jgi:hypothetical protein
MFLFHTRFTKAYGSSIWLLSSVLPELSGYLYNGGVEEKIIYIAITLELRT